MSLYSQANRLGPLFCSQKLSTFAEAGKKRIIFILRYSIITKRKEAVHIVYSTKSVYEILKASKSVFITQTTLMQYSPEKREDMNLKYKNFKRQ